MKTPSFSRIVCGCEPLQSAFDSLSFAVKLWWRIVLWLHGKPTAPQLSDEERTQIVADGFRFYAALYRFLSLLFFGVSALLWFSGILETARDAIYWTGAGVLSGAFLWIASGVGFAGAKMFRQNDVSGRLTLTAFLVSIIAWLSAFSVALSIEAQAQNIGSVWLNLGAISVVWAFGVGSYFLEVLYLVAQTPQSTLRP